MKTEEIKFDKSKWGDGPWQTEPDRKEWRDPVTGLPCLAVRNSLGNWCGYAGVPNTHPAYGLSYDGIPDTEFQKRLADGRKRIKIASKLLAGGADFKQAASKAYEGSPERVEPVGAGAEIQNINVHGGLTYAGACSGHICHTPEPGEPDNIWWFGFDAAHAFDHIPGMTEFRITMPSFSKIHEEDVYRDLPYIESEVASLASQLAAMTKLLPAPHEKT